MKKSMVRAIAFTMCCGFFVGSSGADILVKNVKTDLSKIFQDDSIWKDAKQEEVSLMAQPMVAPRPKTTSTPSLRVQAIHDGKWISFRLRWADKQRDEGGKTMEFSDGLAIQFPGNEGPPPPIFMGTKDNPVHIFHWRAQYQYDQEHGKKEMKDIYPNMNVDIYPMEFKDMGSLKDVTDAKREQFSYGRAAGNPQSYRKNSVDEIFAEGFGTSAVIESPHSYAKGEWKNGEWTLVLGRQMTAEVGSKLSAGSDSNVAFAVWEGGHGEVGSRKSVTMSWTPLRIEK
ncbi:MAG: hypothetical protein IPJ71_12075 [Bdellovibrionales bacterium]|nr:hypothetical protein [Bdellovibrionales bacterium]